MCSVTSMSFVEDAELKISADKNKNLSNDFPLYNLLIVQHPTLHLRRFSSRVS